MLPIYVSIIDMVSASGACRLSRVVAQVAPYLRNDHRKFQEVAIAFAMPSCPIRRIVVPKGELFCIT
jgi:hypothetical protein